MNVLTIRVSNSIAPSATLQRQTRKVSVRNTIVCDVRSGTYSESGRNRFRGPDARWTAKSRITAMFTPRRCPSVVQRLSSNVCLPTSVVEHLSSHVVARYRSFC